MGYQTLRQCVEDLERRGHLVRIESEVDPDLEAAEIQRRVYENGGPAVFYERVKGCRFPLVSNLFGTKERTRFLFRDSLEAVGRLIDLKIDPAAFWKNPWQHRGVPRTLLHMLPRKCRKGPAIERETTIDRLPPLVNWPGDGGAFITLPEVYTEHPDKPGMLNSNLGMYRVQLTGGEYQPNRQVGLHYQIHRSIGVHHAAAIRRGERLPVNVFVGGSPAMILSAVMPLPEGLSELTFAGALGRRAIRMIHGQSQLPIYAEADFCLTGWIEPEKTLPEGPFGDHLGYYSNRHDFPVMEVEKVYHRKDAIWPFTVVGRPPQEDTSFGELIHELTGPAIPAVIPGVKEVHAVDAAGVHPLLLAIGSERYVPYARNRQPQELLTEAHAILGQGQLSLAKYLLIVAEEDNPALEIEDIPAFLGHLLERVDWRRDLHFQTQTTIDTLDYSGTGLNAGSKVIIAAAGEKRRDLPNEIPGGPDLPPGFSKVKLTLPGMLVIQAPPFAATEEDIERHAAELCAAVSPKHPLNAFPLWILADDAELAAASLNNFLWVTFTRSNPAADVHGIGSFIHRKHWGCEGSLIIDARIKPHHAAPLVEDPKVTEKVNHLAAPGGPLHGVI